MTDQTVSPPLEESCIPKTGLTGTAGIVPLSSYFAKCRLGELSCLDKFPFGVPQPCHEARVNDLRASDVEEWAAIAQRHAETMEDQMAIAGGALGEELRWPPRWTLGGSAGADRPPQSPAPNGEAGESGEAETIAHHDRLRSFEVFADRVFAEIRVGALNAEWLLILEALRSWEMPSGVWEGAYANARRPAA